MVSATLEFPTGPQTALVSANGNLSFDDLHRLRWLIRRMLQERHPPRPRRVLGCLQDDPAALLALLFVTEVTDYMPVNPALSESELGKLTDGAAADLAVVSRSNRSAQQLFSKAMPVLIWEDIVEAALAALRSGEEAGEQGGGWAGPGRLILHTSGSTGTPKRVPISIASINASAKNIAAGHDLKQDDFALNALPTFHIGALVDVLLAPFAAQGQVAITDQRAPQGLVQALIDHRPTWLQAVPTLLRRLVEDVPPERLAEAGRSLRFIRSISAPVPSDLKAHVEQALGCPVIEMYGMTETAGQIATVPRQPATCSAGSVGFPVGVEVAIMDRHGNILSRQQKGEVCVRGPSVFDGYEGTDRRLVFFEDWFRTGDLGRLDQDGALFLEGRLKEMINVGGEKVSPHEVETAALQMPEILEAAAYSVPHPTLGEQVGLTIAARGDIDTKTVKAFLEPLLASFKQPNSIACVDQLPRLANAKVDRVLLKRMAHVEWQARQSADGPDAVEYETKEARVVAEQWSKILKCRMPNGDDDFFDMGGDSLSATELLLALETALSRKISPNQLFEAPTFKGLVSAVSQVETATEQPTPRPVRYMQEMSAGWPGQLVVPNGLLKAIGSLKPGAPLFWSGQAHREIKAIRETIGARRPLYIAASLRMFKRRTERDFEVVGAQLADEIMSIQPNGPIALGGFCGGAWVMHHAAEELIRRGRSVRAFISFDYWPHREVPFPVVHCMSKCDVNSARMAYARHDLSQDLLHPHGIKTLFVDSKHLFSVAHITPLLSELNPVLDGTTSVEAAKPSAEIWSLDQRREVPKARIRLTGKQMFFAPNGSGSLEVEVTNTSSVMWPRTEVSGLSVQADLINLDGCMRKPSVAYGAFDEDIPPGGSARFTFDLSFPDKRIPLWLTVAMVSQGVGHFKTAAAGARRTLIFPKLFGTKQATPAE